MPEEWDKGKGGRGRTKRNTRIKSRIVDMTFSSDQTFDYSKYGPTTREAGPKNNRHRQWQVQRFSDCCPPFGAPSNWPFSVAWPAYFRTAVKKDWADSGASIFPSKISLNGTNFP